MQPDEALATAGAAGVLWDALAATYGEVEQRIRAQAWDGLEVLSLRLRVLEQDLAPLVARDGAARAAIGTPPPALAALWAETDRVVATLARRRGDLERAAVAARDATAARLARTRVARGRAARYHGTRRPLPRFQSRRV